MALLVQVGMVTANIKLRKVSYLQLLLGEFQDKAECCNVSEPMRILSFIRISRPVHPRHSAPGPA